MDSLRSFTPDDLWVVPMFHLEFKRFKPTSSIATFVGRTEYENGLLLIILTFEFQKKTSSIRRVRLICATLTK